jgi:uncharacterized protein YcbK (DUF882 family)
MMVINDIKISEDFRLSEFESKDNSSVKIFPELVRKVQKVRDLVGLPVRINSGYRTPERNAEVGGVPNSLHCQGRAVDISCAFVSLALLTVAAIMAGFPGVIVYSKYNFLHCDLREIKSYMVPSDWIEPFRLLFPDLAPHFHPWSEVQNASTVEV